MYGASIFFITFVPYIFKNTNTVSQVTFPQLTAEPRVREELQDYYICCLSRELSLYIRRDVLTGRAKFGVSDDGKEVFQVAMARTMAPGDWRADYYRGHTLLLALGLATPEQLLAQLYADAANDPFSGGRQMNNHHATDLLDEQGRWLPQTDRVNLSSDISTTGGQMARGLGLAFASKIYRAASHLEQPAFSRQGKEICHCIIGDASTSEGVFWEAVNAAGVLQVPLAVTVADDGYGISVPKKHQTVKESISDALRGMEASGDSPGIAIYHVKGWDYPALCKAYTEGVALMRRTHQPVLFHVDELTQPQGHSTSGSHERYKSAQRLQWEGEYDCNRQFRLWLLATDAASEEMLQAIEQQARKEIQAARQRAWISYAEPLRQLRQAFEQRCQGIAGSDAYLRELSTTEIPSCRSEVLAAARRMRVELGTSLLDDFIAEQSALLEQRFRHHLFCEGEKSALRVPVSEPVFSEEGATVNGYEVINAFFDKVLETHPDFYAFGEDLGNIGGVNQGFSGLQAKYGEHRVFDTGIREWTIIGQAIGMAMRGLRPLAEIQYLDYVLYAISALSDDLATLRWRTNGRQQAPVIVRTRGHRLEGIWHSGSPMSMLLGSLRGMHLCVPRNMTQAAGMYNTLLQSDDPAMVIECLNGYRQKEKLADNIGSYTVPLGIPEVLREGEDLSLVTYGACVRIAEQACERLEKMGIGVELIDVQTLMPFDLLHRIRESLAKTSRLLVLDEDVPGGASAYILRHILEEQDGYRLLDARPATLCASHHRPAYGDDGNYLSKPSVEDVVEKVLAMVKE